jgi:LytS/YehU family sensor histidine kinase
VLRETLAIGDRHAAPLATELRLARGYADVMAERYADRVAIAWEVDDTLLDREVPVMSLQPLLENVFKHTVERRRGVTRIGVSVCREGDELVLGVEDDAGRLAALARPGGIGLANLRARLAALYGDAARLELTTRPEGGVRAVMRLPC